MNFEDFLTCFDDIQICHTKPCSFSDELLKIDDDSDLEWKETILHDEWIVGKSAGGPGYPVPESFWTNPQFFIKLIDVDDNDNENLVSIIIALMQKDSREKKAKTRGMEAEEFIQFRLFRVNDNVKINDSKNVKFYGNQTEMIGDSGDYINYREITRRFRVKPGNYVIVPSTFEPNKTAKFMLRLYTLKKIETKQLIKDKPVLVSIFARLSLLKSIIL